MSYIPNCHHCTFKGIETIDTAAADSSQLQYLILMNNTRQQFDIYETVDIIKEDGIMLEDMSKGMSDIRRENRPF